MAYVNDGKVLKGFRRWVRVGLEIIWKFQSYLSPLTLYENTCQFHNISGNYIFHFSKGCIWTTWSLVALTLQDLRVWWHWPFWAIQYQQPHSGEFRDRWEAGPYLDGRQFQQLQEALCFSRVTQCLKPTTLNLLSEQCQVQSQSQIICHTYGSQEFQQLLGSGSYRVGVSGTVLSRRFWGDLGRAFSWIWSFFFEHGSPSSPPMLGTI